METSIHEAMPDKFSVSYPNSMGEGGSNYKHKEKNTAHDPTFGLFVGETGPKDLVFFKGLLT